MRKEIYVILAVVFFSLVFLKAQITGKVVQDNRPLLSCGDIIDNRFPSVVRLTSEDPVTQRSCDDGEGLIIRKNFFTLDCNGHLIRGGSGRWSGIKLVSRSHVTIKGCNINGFDYGLEISHSDDNIIESNILQGYSASIFLIGRSGSNIIKYNFFAEGEVGIEDDSYQAGNIVYANDFFSNRTFNPRAPVPSFCYNEIGNYLSSSTEDTLNLQQKSSCGKSVIPYTIMGRNKIGLS